VQIPAKTETHRKKKNLRSSQADKKKYKKAADRILEKIRNFAPENFVNFLD